MKTQNLLLSANDKIALVSNLNTMLAAGIPIMETVNSLLEDSKGNQQKVLLTLKKDLSQGQHVWVSFSKFPKIFDKVSVNIIKASEEAGNLDVALKDMKDNIRKDMEFNNRIKSALMYPVFIMVLFVVVLVVMLVVVVPKISSVFTRMNMKLPLPTVIMIWMSNALMKYTIPIIIGLGLLIFAFSWFYRNNKRMIIEALISLPLISKLARQIDLTRFSRSLYLLLGAGITITSALELCQDVVMKPDIGRAIKHAKNVVFSGRKLSVGLRDHKNVIPTIMLKIVEAGERSGSLDKSMADVSEFLDYEVSNTLKTVTAMMEPILLVVVGVLVGGMMMAIIAPIYGMIGSVGAR